MNERVKTDKAFARTMENAGKLAQASKIASKVYKAIPSAKKEHSDYRIITGKVMKMIKFGWHEEEMICHLLQSYI